jgi:hypothetical protein
MKLHSSSSSLTGIACALLLLPLAALAQPRNQSEDDGEPRPQRESEVKLPPLPRPENLLGFEASAASTNQFFLDSNSITITDDGIVRYTLVVKSPSGAENISYEGIRCETIEFKYYAFGRRDGTWSGTRGQEWRKILYKEVNRQHGVLYADYLCPDGAPVVSAKVAIERLKYGARNGEPPGSSSGRRKSIFFGQ